MDQVNTTANGSTQDLYLQSQTDVVCKISTPDQKR